MIFYLLHLMLDTRRYYVEKESIFCRKILFEGHEFQFKHHKVDHQTKIDRVYIISAQSCTESRLKIDNNQDNFCSSTAAETK